MRRIGIIGGMSWQSSAVTYRLLNELVNERLGGHHSAACLLASVDFAGIEELQRAGDWHGAGERLAGVAAALERAGAECVVLATNTMHKVAPQIEAAIEIPFLHVVDAVAARCHELDVTLVGLLGTRFTMAEPFYVDLLAERGIEAIVPPTEDQATVDSVIFDELVRGITNEASRERYREVMARLAGQGCEAIILGCTEIGLLVDESDAAVPLVDTTVEQVRAAVEWALA
jgi:aspartate racemase